MSDDAPADHGVTLLPADLAEHQLNVAPALASVDELLIDDLTDDEDDAFSTAPPPRAGGRV